LSAVVGLREPRRQREAIGVAAVGRIDLAIESDQARRDRAQRNLITVRDRAGIAVRSMETS